MEEMCHLKYLSLNSRKMNTQHMNVNMYIQTLQIASFCVFILMDGTFTSLFAQQL